MSDVPDGGDADARTRLERPSLSEQVTRRRQPDRGVAHETTLRSDEQLSASSGPRPVDPGAKNLDASLGPADGGLERYGERRPLGEGGMGVVKLCEDRRIGREVAIKVLRPEQARDPEARARFLREARVQGQLEHPSVVPVYDLGQDDDGQPFFSMKRIRGLTLEEILRGQHAGEPALIAAFSRRKLLTALSSVCQAVAFAHSRGVVHRDMKPANIMLGDFGEVNVLDWGVARLSRAPDLELAAAIATESASTRALDVGNTQTGTIVGTPGYMSPEQARGDIDLVDARSDVYAVGAILFELLTLTPLHRGTTPQAVLVETISGVDARPSRRAPGQRIPPELDAICERACALEPEDRYQSLRALNDALERYQEGERDLVRRAELARQQLVQAQLELHAATRGGEDAEERRARGMRELARALALDPQHEGAMSTLGRVLLDPSDELPPTAEGELREVNRRDRAEAASASSVALATWVLAFPLFLLMGVRSWGLVALLGLLVLAQVAYSWWMGHTGNTQPRYVRLALPLMFVSVSVLCVLFGPLVVVPSVAVANAATWMVSLRANRQTRLFIMSLSVGAVVLPLAFQYFGALPASYRYADGVISILPWALDFPEDMTRLALLGITVMSIVLGNLLVGRAVQALIDAERRIFVQAWRLRQLLPRSAPPSTAPAAPPA